MHSCMTSAFLLQLMDSMQEAIAVAGSSDAYLVIHSRRQLADNTTTGEQRNPRRVVCNQQNALLGEIRLGRQSRLHGHVASMM